MVYEGVDCSSYSHELGTGSWTAGFSKYYVIDHRATTTVKNPPFVGSQSDLGPNTEQYIIQCRENTVAH
jgi:hypothetical protein